ncbi:hypothetical protein BDN71DRAFT_1447691 [Pleurotus eryngii]|uniref:Uncharacterized protein n=1 Tax=Pleurotus eryngii TaxID=5323 RepID=A0A9P5ZZ29_PLEER|nr:hypothetical protein BDN71DRAFT_1447691 [Pleurotus eryngii]
MTIDFISSFGGLDELVQIIYQGAHRFVLLSTVDDERLSLHLGMSGPEGRWWRGIWAQDDILSLIGSNPSPILLNTFAEMLADMFTSGDLFISGWNPTEREAEIKLTFGPTSKRPLHVPLVELTSEEAASHATDVFLEIALQAKSRNHRLNAPAYSATSTRAISPPRHAPSRDVDYSTPSTPPVSSPKLASSKPAVPPNKVSTSQHASSLTPADPPTKKLATSMKPPPPKRPIKGASLANPNKKARKYQALEFASDDDE